MIVIWEKNGQVRQKLTFVKKTIVCYEFRDRFYERIEMRDRYSIQEMIQKVRENFKGNYCFFYQKTAKLTPKQLSIDTKRITNMKGMFKNCNKLRYIDVSNFITDQVTNMEEMFAYCNKLKKINISTFNTSNVENMSRMFIHNTNNNIIVNGINTSKVTDMSYMFKKCEHIKKLDISSFDTSKVRNMAGMFDRCEQVEQIIMSQLFDTSNVENMSRMFRYCKLSIIDASGFNTSRVKNMSQMFSSSSAKIINVSSFDTSNVTNMAGMFEHCDEVKTLDISRFNTSNVMNMYQMFFRCRCLQIIDVSHFDTSKVIDFGDTFSRCDGLQDLKLTYRDYNTIFGISTINAKTCNFMFSMATVRHLDLSTFDTRNVSTMSGMFNRCPNLEELEFRYFDETDRNYDTNGVHYKLENGVRVFYNGDTRLSVPPDFRGFDTSNVKDMSDMFYNCTSLKRLIIPFKTPKLHCVDDMFSGCVSLTHLDVSSFTLCRKKQRSYTAFAKVNVNFVDLYSWKTNTLGYETLHRSNIKYVYCAFMRPNTYRKIKYIYDPVYGMYKHI